VAEASGLELTYARGSLEDDGWSNPAAIDALPVAWSERTPAPKADWSTGAPIATPFVAQWQGALRTTFGPHTFTLEAPARAALFLDESLILQTDGAASGSTVSATVTLADGPHRLRLVAKHGEGPVALRWIPPPENENPFLRIPPDVPVLSEPQRIPAEALIADTGAAVGLLARMAPLSAESAGTPLLDAAASALEGAAAYEVIMPRIDANFHIAPVPPPVAVEWSGTLLAPVDGRYLLAMTATDQARVEVDGAVLLETAAAGLTAEAPINLTAGLHELRVLFGSRGPHVRARFEWVPPGGVRSPVPSLLLHPPYGSTDALAKTGRLAAATFAAQQSEFAPLQSTGDPLSGELLPELVAAGLARPTGVAVGNDGRVFVAESGAGAVRIFAADGSDLGAITEGDGPLVEPFDVARMPDGTLLVLDAARAALLLYSSDGAFLRAIPADLTLLDRSRGLDVDAEGRIWIAVTAGGRIVALDGEGALLREFEAGDSGAQPVDLLAVAGVEAGPPPSLYATVLGTNEGVRYDDAGARIASWALPPANTIDAPHLAAAPGRGIYVTVPEERRIELRAADTTLIASWRLPEALRIKPVALAVDAQGAFYVTDTEGGALWRVAPPALP
jgi:streptogramin lyase